MDRWAEADAALSAADPALAEVIGWAGPCTLARRKVAGGPFGALARAVCYQQLAGAAASAIHARFVALFDGQPTPDAVVTTPVDVLRSVGLSAAKVASILDLATKALDGTVRLDRLSRMTDDDIVERLTLVRGIGPWTAEMFLMFQLNRPDVWPVGDFGVRAGYGRIHGMETAPTAKELKPLGDPYRPFRTIAAWYCWRAMDARPAAAPGTAATDAQVTAPTAVTW